MLFVVSADSLSRQEERSARSARAVLSFVLDASRARPYWDARGFTFQDPDGYRIVVANDAWP
jgi:hypothetical protein